MKMKKVIDRTKYVSSSGLSRNAITLLLECGHTIIKHGADFHNAKYQKLAKCQECNLILLFKAK